MSSPVTMPAKQQEPFAHSMVSPSAAQVNRACTYHARTTCGVASQTSHCTRAHRQPSCLSAGHNSARSSRCQVPCHWCRVHLRGELPGWYPLPVQCSPRRCNFVTVLALHLSVWHALTIASIAVLQHVCGQGVSTSTRSEICVHMFWCLESRVTLVACSGHSVHSFHSNSFGSSCCSRGGT